MKKIKREKKKRYDGLHVLLSLITVSIAFGFSWYHFILSDGNEVFGVLKIDDVSF